MAWRCRRYPQSEEAMAKKPSHHNQEWTTAQERELGRLADGNTPTRVIGLKLGRTPAAVQNKASELDISLRPNNQSPYNRRK
jgi:hypothetical protein